MKSNFKAQVDAFELIGKYHGNISRAIKNLLDLTDSGEPIRKNGKDKFEWNRKGLTIEICKDKHEQMAFIRIFVELPILFGRVTALPNRTNARIGQPSRKQNTGYSTTNWYFGLST